MLTNMITTLRFIGPITIELLDPAGVPQESHELIGSIDLEITDRQVKIVGQLPGSGLRVFRMQKDRIIDLGVFENNVSMTVMAGTSLKG